jgi:uncharacterized integral membrane protein (TIGR00698 family)
VFNKVKVSTSIIMPGLAISVTIGFAASFLGEHYGAPTMLFALLLGMALGFLYENEQSVPGINFAGSKILRIGVALLGLRIAFSDVMDVGFETIALITLGVVTTIILGTFVARLTGMKSVFGSLTGGAVAICGASAALAISAVLPDSPEKEKNTIFTVIGVTSLSTLAMIFYPIIAGALGHSDADAGLFLGATIHDVAQVVGAGYSISDDAGNTATLIKLIRVAYLVPVVFIIAFLFRNKEVSGAKSSVLPAFLLGFAGLVILNSLVTIPAEIKDAFISVSRFMLVTAIAAIGLKSNLKELVNVGFRPVILMVVETVWLAGFVLVAIEMGA